MIKREDIREILLTIFRAWKLQHERNKGVKDSRHLLSSQSALHEITQDLLVASTLDLFAEWDNDLISIAPFYGVGYYVPGDGLGEPIIRSYIPPAPTAEHYWDYDLEKWVLLEDQYGPDDVAA